MELQKIHRVLWAEIQRRLGEQTEITFAGPAALVFRPMPKLRTVSLRFEKPVWQSIADEADNDARLEQIARNVANLVEWTMRRYKPEPPTAFVIEIDDRALDE